MLKMRISESAKEKSEVCKRYMLIRHLVHARIYLTLKLSMPLTALSTVCALHVHHNNVQLWSLGQMSSRSQGGIEFHL